MYVCVCMYVCMCMYMYMYICVCICIYNYIQSILVFSLQAITHGISQPARAQTIAHAKACEGAVLKRPLELARPTRLTGAASVKRSICKVPLANKQEPLGPLEYCIM